MNDLCGADILAIANQVIFDRCAAATTISVIERAVNNGEITPQRIDESYRRIMRLKARLG